MAHVSPFVLIAGRSLQGTSLGFHAYSLRVDNICNQWLQEQSTLTWIPPYSLGVIVRLWGTSVALLLAVAPQGQPQLAPIVGEYAVAVFSDEYRTENPGVPVRQFTLVQAVSDLTEGPQPALPPVGVCRIWSDPAGVIHHVHSDGSDCTLIDTCTVLGGGLSGHLPNPQIAPNAIGSAQIIDGSITTADIGNQQITQTLLAKPSVGPGELFAGAAASNVGALGGALTGTLPNPGLQQGPFQYLANGFGLSATVWQSAASMTIGPGAFLLWAMIQFINIPAGGGAEARITDGGNVWASGGITIGGAGSFHAQLTMVAFVTPGALTTYNLQGWASGAGASVYHISPATGQARATGIVALRLA